MVRVSRRKNRSPASASSPCANVPSFWTQPLKFRSYRSVVPWCGSSSPATNWIPMPAKIKVLLVDDHSLVRRGFRRILEDEADIVVIGEASNGDEAVRLARELAPQVIVMDCALPGTSGLAATRKILEAAPEKAILMLSMHSEDTLVRQALDAGARGYILKNAVDLELATAIRKVAAGEIVLDPQLSRSDALKGERNSGLTVRELQILQLIVNTVGVHRANIMDALGIHKTADLVVYAIRNGLVNIS